MIWALFLAAPSPNPILWPPRDSVSYFIILMKLPRLPLVDMLHWNKGVNQERNLRWRDPEDMT